MTLHTAAAIAAGLSRREAKQLTLLKDLVAISEATARCKHDHRGEEIDVVLMTTVLIPRGLVAHARRDSGRAVWWLTDAGYTVADLLTRDLDTIGGHPCHG